MNPELWNDGWADYTFMDPSGEHYTVLSTSFATARRIAMRRARRPVVLIK